VNAGADITIARVYDADTVEAGRARLLVDRLWPRGIRKADLAHDDWIREVAPSNQLRKWFGHLPERWDEFANRYRAELDQNPDAVKRCLDWCDRGPVTLLYAAKDPDRNQAVVLCDYLRKRLGEKDA